MPAKVEPTPALPGLSPIGGKPVIARFDGGSLSSDGGLLVLREVEQRLNVAGRLAACIADPRDPTGLEVYGAGEWLVAKHGERGTRTWRKLHLAVDPSTGEILASELTSNEEGDASQVGPLLGQIAGPITSVPTDGAYDGEPVYRAVAERQPNPPVAVVIPPRSTAVPSPDFAITPSQRDRHIQMIQVKGRLGWQRAVGYGRRSHAETAMFRYKAIIGSSLRARTLPAQKTEAKIACSALNRMTHLGMPVCQRVR